MPPKSKASEGTACGMLHSCLCTAEEKWPRQGEEDPTKAGDDNLTLKFWTCNISIFSAMPTQQEQAVVAAALAKVKAAYDV